MLSDCGKAGAPFPEQPRTSSVSSLPDYPRTTFLTPVGSGAGGKRRACALARAGAARLVPDRPALSTRSVPPVPPPDAEEGCDWAHLLPVRPDSILLPTIGSPGKDQSVGGGLLLRDLAPPRKPLLADARDRDCSLPAPATTLPARALSASPALPPWPPLCGVGRSWSSHSAPAASSPARCRIPRNRVSQSRREGFPLLIQGQNSFPHLERQKLRVSPPFRIRSQRVSPSTSARVAALPISLQGTRPLVYHTSALKLCPSTATPAGASREPAPSPSAGEEAGVWKARPVGLSHLFLLLLVLGKPEFSVSRT